jgi:hypothetical protein
MNNIAGYRLRRGQPVFRLFPFVFLLLQGCMPFSPPARQYREANMEDIRLLSNYRVNTAAKWKLEVWTDGSLFSPGDPIDVVLRLTRTDGAGDSPPDGECILKLTEAGGQIVREKTKHPRFRLDPRPAERVLLVDGSGGTSLADLSPGPAWEASLPDALQTNWRTGRQAVLPKGWYSLDVNFSLSKTDNFVIQTIPIEVNRLVGH